MTQRLRVTLFLLFAAGGSLYQSWADPDPCLIYSIYSDMWRDPAQEADTVYCDNRLTEGWYTFHLGHNRAYIPTTCMQEKTCGAEVPLHVDLGGHDMPEVGETLNASLCGSFRVLGTVECCVLRQEIRIKHCDNPPAIIYYLKPQPYCSAAICVLRVEDSEVDRKYRFESGDVPLSLQATTTAAPSTVFISSTDSSSPALSNTTELTDSSSPNTTEVSSQENTTIPVSSTETTVATTNSTAEMASDAANNSTDPMASITTTTDLMTSRAATFSTDLLQDSYHLQLILLVEDYEGPENLKSRLKKAVRLSTREADDASSASIQVSECCSRPGAHIAQAIITSNHTAEGMSGYTVQDLVDLDAFQSSLSGDLTLLAACTVQGLCEQLERPWRFNLLLFILILVSFIATALFIYGSVRLYKHCSKRGTWVPPPDQKGDAESVDTGKPTDTVKSQSANGPDGSKPDDAGWWVVPLDQAPGNEDVENKTTQETKM